MCVCVMIVVMRESERRMKASYNYVLVCVMCDSMRDNVCHQEGNK